MNKANALITSAIILVLFINGFGHRIKSEVTIDDLFIGFIKYFENKEFNDAYTCLKIVGDREPEKRIYMRSFDSIYNDEKRAEALKLLEQRRNQSPTGTELRVNQILTAEIHWLLAEVSKRKKDYFNAIIHYKKASEIAIVYRRNKSALILNNIGGVYSDLGQEQKAVEYFEKSLSISREMEDRTGEAIAMINMGRSYLNLSMKPKALEYYKKALPIFREEGDRINEAITLTEIGLFYSDIGKYRIALEYLEDVLFIHRDMKNRSDEATMLNVIGKIYFDLGQKKKSLEYLEKALPIIRKMRNQPDESISLFIIGMVYFHIDQHQKALEYFEAALFIHRKLGDQSLESSTLICIANVYNELGQKHKSLEYCKKALSICHEIGDQSKEAYALKVIGEIYSDLGQSQNALDYYENALSIRLKMGDQSGEAATLNAIGRAYSTLGRNQKALYYYEKALAIRRAVADRAGEAATLNNIGKVYSDRRENQKALDYYEKALFIRRELGNSSGEADTLNNIGKVYSDIGQKQYPLAIFYGKQAVNTLQNLRQNIDILETKTKVKYLQYDKDVYRFTVNQLIFCGRLREAQQVLDILKSEEYFTFVMRNRSVYSPPYSPLEYTDFESKWIKRQNTLVERIFAINASYHDRLIQKPNATKEEKKVNSLKTELEKLQKEHRDFFFQMKKAFETHNTQKDLNVNVISKQSYALKEYLKSLDQNNNEKAAVLHYFIFKGKISVIITTPTSQTVKQSSSFDEKEFNKMIFNYRHLLKESALLSRIANPSSKEVPRIDELSRQKRDIENKLYHLIFHPVDQYLKQYGAVNLLVSLDGVLRYIPLGSLWDGQHYLLQKYRFVRITPSSSKHVSKEKPVFKNKILGMAASKGSGGFTPLPHVCSEIRAIVHDREKGCNGFIDGNALIDYDFTKDAMIKRLKTASYPLVYIASHFKFSPGNETSNRLLLGDGTTINLGDIRKKGKLFDGVKLLVLSACQTGMGGNGGEIDGFGELAQQCGAGSVVVSLWAVDDESTKEFMVNFYSILKEGKVSNKIEALRLAQLQLAGLEDKINNFMGAFSETSSKKTGYSHPYYWAPFIMMGNWR